MDITITRNWKKAGYTIGRLYIDGQYVCDTLEPQDRGLRSSMALPEIRKLKAKGKTAVPTGLYPVTRTWSPRFKRVLPLVGRVPGFDGVRLHPGNTARDTEGCVLPGVNSKAGMVLDSRKWLSAIDSRIEAALKGGQDVWLEIKD